jgi:23S rRNA (adenine2503-C2)-methyltransferase
MSELVAIRPPQRGLPRHEQPHLRDLSPEQLQVLVTRTVGGPRYRADQIFEWLHRHRASDLEAMTNLTRSDRQRLAEAGRVSVLHVERVQHGADGTRKLRLRTEDDQAIESVLIPNEARGLTLCISSMIGCSLTCRFCATATLGFVRNLAAWEILDQVYRAQDLLMAEAEQEGAPHVARITNVVLMGMGEPLHNFNQVHRAIELLTDDRGAALAGRRITVSTAGLVPGIERFAREGLAEEVGLAVSLNATTDAVRDAIMPINTRWNIATLLQAVRQIPSPRRRRVTFEYVLLAGINDSDADARRLGTLLGDMDGQVNAIPFNPHPGAGYARPRTERIESFVRTARGCGLQVHVRTPRGDDIAAACGQLALEGTAPR